MKNLSTYIIISLVISLNFCTVFSAVPRDSNFNNTDGYKNSGIDARLLVNVKDTTKVVHFIRDNNDPRVVTKAYIIKNVDAYEFRDYLRQMVQAKRVGNTSLVQEYPSNTSNPNIATTSSVGLTTPISAQPSYSPTSQLGSNTAVECLKYVDGTGLLIISAEDYRFEDQATGMGFDTLVEFLDKPGMGSSFGTQTFFYIPKYVPARNLKPLIENVGMNISDVTELWQGSDLVAYDSDLNWLVFDTTNYSMYNIEKMLELYDVPIPQVKLKIKIYEIYDENDEKIGMDFQNWKNNEGADFFSAGGRYRDNWSAVYSGGMAQTGSERTSYYNFNPKWSTRYIDLLSSVGKAKVAYTGEISVRNNTSASLERTTQLFYIDTSEPVSGTTVNSNVAAGAYKLLSKIIDEALTEDIAVEKGNAQTTKSSSYGFEMTVANASVNLLETSFDVTIENSSLIGFQSSGSPRISKDNTITVTVSLPHGKDSFVIGGLKKQERVKSSSGVPILMDIPYVKYLFSTESTSIKNSELVVVAQCEWDSPPKNNDKAKTKAVKKR